jgi:hypothetical protein
MAKTWVFISFDHDHDTAMKTMLVGQSTLRDSPFEVADWSLKEDTPDWEQETRKRIKQSEVVVVIVGEHMATATGVSKEIKIARDEKARMFGLRGRADKPCPVPQGYPTVYAWTWDNLKKRLAGR